MFVSKFNADGTALVYSTYLGGSGGDAGFGIALDSANNAYITGTTYSTNFPVTCGTVQQNNRSLTSGASTAFVTKINALGNHLVYSTYLGGQGNLAPQNTPQGDVGQAIAVSAPGNAYVTGYTWSSNFPTTTGSFQHSFQGEVLSSGGATFTPNAFVIELNSTGTRLLYSTYLGGSVGDYGNAIAINHAGNAFVAGSTSSGNFPVTAGALQTTLKASPNGFVTELNLNGTAAVYSTYLGGTGGDSALAIALDSAGVAYVAGKTSSSDFPTTNGVVEGSNLTYLQNFVAYGPVGFAAKLSLNGSALQYSTYVEGHDTAVTGLAVDTSGNAYITGNAATAGAGLFAAFQGTPDAFPLPASTGNSAFLVKLNPSASVLNYATLLGGSGNDAANALALDAAGNTYITGSALSTDFPTSTEAYQATNNAATANASNAFVGKFALASTANQTSYNLNLPSVPIPTSLTLNSAQWYPGVDWAILVDVTLNSGGPGPPPTGTVDVSVNGTIGCCEEPGIVSESTTWTGVSNDIEAWNFPNGNGSPGSPWEATYSGDALYGPSSVTGTACAVGVDCSFAVRSSLPPLHSTLKMKLSPSGKATASLESANWSASKGLGPQIKFPLPPAVQQNGDARLAQSEAQTACIAPLPTLAVKALNISRYYGAANPTLPYTVTGLLNGDTVTVTASTTAVATSRVHIYPIDITVTGADVANYTLMITNAVLTVVPAPLRVWPSPATLGVTYGSPIPTLTGYSFTGFVNGETAGTAVSGTPVLSTTAISTSPVGFYPINIAPGTLASVNYSFQTMTGRFYIYKAPLTATIQNATIHRGQPLPAFTFTLTGFVNGDTQATAVTGAPVLSTTATSSSPVGHYPITGTLGTLQSNNYSFIPVNGVLTILP